MDRRDIIKNNTINLLEENDPLERLKELCSQGDYNHTFIFDIFNNCIIIRLEIFYFKGTRRIIMLSESMKVDGTNVMLAKRNVSAKLLENNGLAPLNLENDMEEIYNVASKVVSDLSKSSFFDMFKE